MTSQKDQIQALIADIDAVLQKTPSRLPWVMAGDAAQQRRVLARVSNFLVSLQQRMAIEGGGAPIALSDLTTSQAYSLEEAQLGEALGSDRSSEMATHQTLQGMMQEMEHLRVNLIQPLQTDVENLRQQREHLMLEIRQLEARRQYASELSPMTPYQSLEQLRVFQDRLDEVVRGLDSTLNVVFESLQRNVNAYEESLGQGIDKLHHLGQQGEIIFTALINHLAQKLGQEVSSHLPSSLATSRLQPADQCEEPSIPSSSATREMIMPGAQEMKPFLPSESNIQAGQEITSFPDLSVLGMTFPDAAMEISPTGDEKPPRSIPFVDQAIDSWLSTAGTAEATEAADQNVEDLTTADLEIAELDLSDLELNQLSQDEIDMILNMDPLSSSAGLQATPIRPEALTLPQSPFDPAEVEQPALRQPTQAIEAITALTDLFGDEETTEPEVPASDLYPPASPEEVLLPEQPQIAMPDLVLDESTLSSLSQDLSSLDTENAPDTLSLSQGEPVSSGDWALEGWMQEPASSPPLEHPVLEDWSDDTLDDFAAALPTAELAPTSIEAQSSIPPTDTNALALEGMDDLFADFPPEQTIQSPDLSSTSSLSQPPDLSQSEPFSLEEMQDLFTSEVRSPASSADPTSVQPDQAESTSAFTLEGLEELFGDLPATGSSVSMPVSSADPLSAFSLEGIEDLLGDVSPTVPTSSVNQPALSSPISANQASLNEEPLSFTLQEIEDLFADLEGERSAVDTSESARMDDEEPTSPSPSPDAELPETQGSSTQFRLEQVDDVFVEVLPDEP